MALEGYQISCESMKHSLCNIVFFYYHGVVLWAHSSVVTSISSCLFFSNSVFGFGSIQAVNRARMSGFGFVIFQKRTFTIIVGSLPPSAATH